MAAYRWTAFAAAVLPLVAAITPEYVNHTDVGESVLTKSTEACWEHLEEVNSLLIRLA